MILGFCFKKKGRCAKSHLFKGRKKKYLLKNNPEQATEKFHVINGYQKQVGEKKQKQKRNLFSPASKKSTHTHAKILRKFMSLLSGLYSYSKTWNLWTLPQDPTYAKNLIRKRVCKKKKKHDFLFLQRGGKNRHHTSHISFSLPDQLHILLDLGVAPRGHGVTGSRTQHLVYRTVAC